VLHLPGPTRPRPLPDLTDTELRAGLDLLPTWAQQQKAAANRKLIAVMRERLERGEPMVPMYGPLGLAWLQRQAEIAEQLLQTRTGSPPADSLIPLKRPRFITGPTAG
jgi:hypothetical protein